MGAELILEGQGSALEREGMGARMLGGRETMRLRIVILVVAVAAALTYIAAPQASGKTDIAKVQYIIRYVFGDYGSQAIAVSRCETGGTFWPGSHSGQYLGLFQMGSDERRQYGHSPTAWGQAISAYKMFADSHFSWRRWSCKP